jgi:hypothetical protein
VRETARSVYRPPGGRTERTVAAEVIVRLLEAGVLPRTPTSVARAAGAVGVPIALVRQVWAVHEVPVPLDNTLVTPGDDLVPLPAKSPTPETAVEQGESDAPAASVADSRPISPVVDPVGDAGHPCERDAKNPADRPEWIERNTERIRSYNARKVAEKNPRPGIRICSICKEEKSSDEFKVKDRKRGNLRSACDPCMKKYQQDRYLSSTKLKALGSILRFVLEAGDEHAGMICPDCRQPCRVGDEVIATDAVLHHANHHPDQMTTTTGDAR